MSLFVSDCEIRSLVDIYLLEVLSTNAVHYPPLYQSQPHSIKHSLNSHQLDAIILCFQGMVWLVHQWQ